MPEKNRLEEAYQTASYDLPGPSQVSPSAPDIGQRKSYKEHIRAGTSKSEGAGVNVTFRPSVFSRKSTATQDPEPNGLRVLYTPSDPHSVDIIFLHGLGGSSKSTWSLRNEPDSFWPQAWLPNEQEINTARILTFGYNADFRAKGPNNQSSISDFARALLFGMKFGKDADGLTVGQKPIIFVVHSMGGLVLKKACVQGYHDQNYAEIIQQVRAVLFLSTPHRGTKLAEYLNGLLSLGGISGHHPKQFINELSRNSPSIEELNESFRHFAPSLKLFSFYETIETSIAGKSFMLLEKSSSTLGYPEEIIHPLDANHHNVCKFTSQEDPNYQSVSSVLRGLVEQYKNPSSQSSRRQSVSSMKKLENFLGIDIIPQRDYISLLHRCKAGTCEAILTNHNYEEWERDTTRSKILWLHGRPGAGKSVQAAFLIDHLLRKGRYCQFFFFQHGDAAKQTAGDLLRSLALQIAHSLPLYETTLAAISNNNLKFDRMDTRTIWEKLYVSALFPFKSETALYWVIDAVDDAESAYAVIELFSSLTASQIPINVLLTSRDSPLIRTALKRVDATIHAHEICLDNNVNDIRRYVNAEKRFMHGSQEFLERVVDQLVHRAEGSFLWTYLAVREISECHEERHVLQVLHDIPSEMEDLYRHMERTIADLKRPPDIALSKMILAWTTYSRRPLHADELLEALRPEHDSILDLRRTIHQLCGHFVEIDGSNRVTLVHHTAREYLINKAATPFLLKRGHAHEALFRKTLLMYIHRHLRRKVEQEILPPLYSYAATSWAYHLGHSTLETDDALNLMSKFFSGTFVLPWIQALAILGHLNVLVSTSQALTSFTSQQRGFYQRRMALIDRVSDFDTLESWAVDLLKLVGKFGANLLEDPTSIYAYIPPFCPHNSQIYKLQRRSTNLLSVEGLSNNDDWDDLLARLSVGSEHEASALACSGRYIAVLTSAGKIILWNSITFEELRILDHRELVFKFCFSNGGDLVTTYGYRTTKIWDVASGQSLHELTNPPQVKPLALTFTPRDLALLVGLNDRTFARHVIGDSDSNTWKRIDSAVFSEDAGIAGAVLNSPKAIQFSPDGTQVAIAHRQYPLSTWTLDPAKLTARCRRLREGRPAIWTGVVRLTWHPRNGQILGIYTDGSIFKWHPVDQTHEEIKVDSTPSEIQISFDGSVFLTGDVDGTIKLYNTSLFQLAYQLSSDDIVTSICFSPDGRRFYDIRGSCANIWEPNSLLRLYEGKNDPANETETWGGSVQSMSLIASEANAETYIPVTALAARQEGNIICIGNGEGMIEMEDTRTYEKAKVDKSKSGMIIEDLVWADNGSCYAYVELGSRLIVKSVDMKGKSAFPPKTTTTMKERLHSLDSGAHHLLINPTGNFVLVSTLSSAQIWSVDRHKICGMYKPSRVGEQVKWAAHPIKSDHILAFTPTTIEECTWQDLRSRSLWYIQNSAQASPESDSDEDKPGVQRAMSNLVDIAQAAEVIDQIIISHNKAFILLFLCHRVHHRRRYTRLLILESAKLASAPTSTDDYLDNIPIPPDIAPTIVWPLQVIGQDRLVFLDKSFRVCSYSIRHTGSPTTVAQHFFLPRDWVNAESLELCQVLSDGTFLCPRRGEVAIIRSDLESQF